MRAKAVRTRALLALHEGNAAAALKAIDEADSYAAPADRSLRAQVIRAEDSTQAALAYLGEAKSERETEVKASLLMEAGCVDDALAELDCLPVNGPERQRLRALALCVKGERDQAVLLADTARKSEPRTVVFQLTLGILHVMAALSPRANVQFGAVPMLIEMVLTSARCMTEPLPDKVRWVGAATEIIVQAWPKSVRGAVIFLDRSIAKLPVKDAAPLWPAFNRLRALFKTANKYPGHPFVSQ